MTKLSTLFLIILGLAVVAVNSYYLTTYYSAPESLEWFWAYLIYILIANGGFLIVALVFTFWMQFENLKPPVLQWVICAGLPVAATVISIGAIVLR